MFGDIPVWARLLITLMTFVAAVLVALFISVRWGAGLFGLAIVMIVFCERSRGEKSGYKF